MKKKIFIILASGIASLLSVGVLPMTQTQVKADNTNPRVEQVKFLINEIDPNKLTYNEYIYVCSIKTLYNSLTEEEKALIETSLIDKLDSYISLTKDLTDANDFETQMDYYLTNPSFGSQYILSLQDEKFNKLSTSVQSKITNYTEENKNTIKTNAALFTPDIYYNFKNPEKSGTKITNQGVLSNKDATLCGNANTDNGYLSFGTNSGVDGSYLKLPEEMFSFGSDFTLTLEYERTTDTNDVSLFSFGTEAYSCGGETTNAGFRAAIHTGYDRGPTNYMKLKTGKSEQGYTGIVHANSDNKNHLIRMTIRYISDASCLQVCTVDTITDYYMYVNQGCSYPSYNQYTRVNTVNMPFEDFNFNVLGAYNGNASYPGGATTSFDGKIYSFAFYNRLVSEYEIYGVDFRGKAVGCNKIIEYVNNFECPSNKEVLIRYAKEYEKMFAETHDDVLSIPYDYRYLYNPEKLQAYLEAYEFLQNI